MFGNDSSGRKDNNFVNNSVENNSATILVAVIISLLVAAALVGALVCIITRRRSARTGGHRKLSVIHIQAPSISTVSNAPKMILLLWLRDSTQLIQQVEHLKNEMLNHCNAKVSLKTLFRLLS